MIRCTHDRSIETTDWDVGLVQERHDAFRRARAYRRLAQGQHAEIVWVNSVDVLFRIYGFDDR